MVVDTVAEEHALCICLESRELRTCAVSLIILKYILEDLADLKIVSAVLHPDYITAILCSLCKMIYIFLLLKGQIIPSMDLISHYLKVRELIYKVFEILFLSSKVGA